MNVHPSLLPEFAGGMDANVHQQVLEPDRLKLAQHLEEQKAQKRRISRRVTVVKQTLKNAGVKAQRYIDYEPADDLANANTEEANDKYIMYCETIDESRDRKEAVILSETANEIARVAEQAYTAVICMADRSFTHFSAAELPMKKLYALPDVAFLGPSRVRNKPLRIPIVVFSFLLFEH